MIRPAGRRRGVHLPLFLFYEDTHDRRAFYRRRRGATIFGTHGEARGAAKFDKIATTVIDGRDGRLIAVAMTVAMKRGELGNERGRVGHVLIDTADSPALQASGGASGRGYARSNIGLKIPVSCVGVLVRNGRDVTTRCRGTANSGKNRTVIIIVSLKENGKRSKTIDHAGDRVIR